MLEHYYNTDHWLANSVLSITPKVSSTLIGYLLSENGSMIEDSTFVVAMNYYYLNDFDFYVRALRITNYDISVLRSVIGYYSSRLEESKKNITEIIRNR